MTLGLRRSAAVAGSTHNTARAAAKSAEHTEVVDVDDLIEVPDVHTRVMIEEAAIDVVWTWLEKANWEVHDVQKENLG